MAEALYRKYRPQIFEDVVGQEHIERTIKNAIEQDKVSHAYLFCGPRGTGKTTTARLLAKALLCESGPTAEPDGTCEMCELVAKGEHPDVYELDAASRTGVENVREEIIGRVHYAPTRGRYKIYIIDEVHMLSVPAFNALLKTLEEPPAHVVFILATTDPQKVPETIHSRCQRFDFRRIDSESMVSRLGAICTAEEVECEPEALELIAHRADGGMRNALTSLEQLIVFCGGNITLDAAERMLGGADSDGVAKLMKAVGAQDAAACFQFVDELAESGSDVATFVRQMAQFARNLYVMSLAGAKVELPLGPSERRELEAVAPAFGPDRASRMLGVLGDLQVELKTSTNQRLSLEIALTRMVRPQADLTMEALAQRLETLERGFAALSSGAAAPGAAPASFAAPAPASASAAPASAAPAAAPAAPARPVAPASAPASQSFVTQASASAPAQAASAPAPSAVPAPASAPVPTAAAPAPQPTGAVQASVPAPAAPAPAETPVSAASAPSGLANPAVVQRLWQAVLGAARAQGGGLATFLGWASASFNPATGGIVATFDGSQQFVYNQVQKPENVRFVAQALQTTFGQPVPFAFALGSAAGAASGAPVSQPLQQPAGMAASVPAARPAQQPAPAPAQPVQGGATPRPAAQAAAASSPGIVAPTPASAPAPAPAAQPAAAQGAPAAASAAADTPPWEGGPASATGQAAPTAASSQPAQAASASPSAPAQTPQPAAAASPSSMPQPTVPAGAPAQPSVPSPSPQAQPAPTAPTMAMPAEPPDTTSAASAARSAAVEVSGEGGGAEYLQSVLAAGGFGQAITVSDVSGGSAG
ncbi:DNA polymerase III subunit gamma/tau [Adlercreutzia aquisgranensis]|uniref:DNA polymerase III subunit gamma/tau n=1 Tax=Adlercreutzia aquisgranensis TaxID=2941323 RepID=UPI00203DCB4E|nr:DNA polymerase III subunit gamma/tau [Adlercreutzia aquisgranensis]